MPRNYTKEGSELVIKTDVVVEERLSMETLLSIKARLEQELSQVNAKITQATNLGLN